MKLVLIRHGNTFNPGDKIVWAGAGQDFSLVEKGRAQIREVANYLKENNIYPDLIVCGPLKRTYESSIIISDTFGLTEKVRIDPRLNELDYGLWGGLTNQEVEDRFGVSEQAGWNRYSQWPESAKWGQSEDEIIKEVGELVVELYADYSEETVLCVTSNGRLRYFLKLIEDEFKSRIEQNSFKMKTGAISLLNIESSRNSIEYWNYTEHLS